MYIGKHGDVMLTKYMKTAGNNCLKRYKRLGYNMDIMRQSACLVVNPITVDSLSFLFNCTTVGQASDLMTALTKSFNLLVGV